MKLKLFYIISILLFVVFISGCTSLEDKTYSNNGLNFTYPGDMQENATFVFVQTPTADAEYETIGNDKLKIAVVYTRIESDIQGTFSFDQFKQLVWNELSSNQDDKVTQLYAGDKSTNGTTIYEEIYTSKDPVSDEILKNKRVVFINNYNSMHQIIFQALETDFESLQETITKIQNSVILT